ncbi:MAG: L,D-transpeptidase family protein [Kiritimatiellia bacterium]|nr:L,D-transpeptidase family protein [Kiritimatiellia bacterium]
MDEMMILNDGGSPRKPIGPILVALVVVAVLGAGMWYGVQAIRGGSEARREAELAKSEEAARQVEAAAAAARRAADPAPAMIQAAREAQTAGYLSEAREKAYEALAAAVQPENRVLAEQYLGELNLMLLTNPYPMAEKEDYTIQSGDKLAVLARRFGTTVELISRSNNIRGHLIRPGDRIRILRGAFRVEVNLTENTLTLLLNYRFIKKYPVGTGQFQKTPAGEFKITDRIAQPTWWRPDGKEIPYGHPENVLGTHWLSLDLKGYGIHGTWQPESIGKRESAGCVRLLNTDIEELYTLLPVGVGVRILP